MNGITLKKILYTLASLLTGKRLICINLLTPETVALKFDNFQYELIVSINALNCGIYLIEKNKFSETKSDAFIRKANQALKGCILKSIAQKKFDRLIKFEFINKNKEIFSIICELTGRHANVIILKGSKIFDVLRKTYSSITDKRIILPKNIYTPPENFKVPIPALAFESFKSLLEKPQNESEILNVLLSNIDGTDKIFIKEVIYHSYYENKISILKLYKNLNRLYKSIFQSTSVYVYGETLSLIELCHLKTKFIKYDSIITGIKNYFETYLNTNIFNKLQYKAQKKLKKLLKQKKRALEFANKDYTRVLNADHYLKLGENLKNNFHLIKPGQTELSVLDFNGNKITIPLSPHLSKKGNLNKIFKKYKRLKASKTKVEKRIKNLKAELEYLESLDYYLKLCTNLPELINFLKSNIIFKELTNSFKHIKIKSRTFPPYIEVKIFQNTRIYIGKSAKSNDYLIKYKAKPSDLWLHVKHGPGSHVIVSGEINETILEKAAQFAAFYSKHRNSGKTPVIYTKVKYLRKTKGLHAGMVLYKNEKSLVVIPLKPEIEY